MVNIFTNYYARHWTVFVIRCIFWAFRVFKIFQTASLRLFSNRVLGLPDGLLGVLDKRGKQLESKKFLNAQLVRCLMDALGTRDKAFQNAFFKFFGYSVLSTRTTEKELVSVYQKKEDSWRRRGMIKIVSCKISISDAVYRLWRAMNAVICHILGRSHTQT